MNNVTLCIGANRLKICPKLPSEVLDYLRKKTSFKPAGYVFAPKYISGIWNGDIQVVHKDQTAPTGVYMRLEKLLKEKDYEVSKTFEHDYQQQGNGHIHGIDLYDYQKAAAKKLIKHRYCLAQMPVRSGKTAVIAHIIALIDHYPVWVVTSGKDLVRQTVEALEGFLRVPIGVFSESTYEQQNIVVSSYQALIRVFSDAKESNHIESRNTEIKESIRKTMVCIYDEAHHAFSQKNKKVLEAFGNVGYRIGLSGTAKPSKLRKIQLEVGIGPIVYRLPFKKLIENKKVAQPIVTMYDLPNAWYRQHLPEYPDIYDGNIMLNSQRNKFIAEIVGQLKKQKKTVFVMVRRKEHGRILDALIKGSVYVYGDVAADVRKTLYDRLEARDLQCIIATVGKEGLNLPRLDAVINAEGLEGDVVTVQKMRSLTANPGKKYGLVIDFIDKGLYLQGHSETRLAQYKKLAGFIVKERRVPEDYFKNE